MALISASALMGGGFRLAEQLAGLAVHALGHAFGLSHCTEPACAMNPAESPEEAARLVPHLGWQCRMDLVA